MYFAFDGDGNFGKGATLELALEDLINEGNDFSMTFVEWYKSEKIKVKLTIDQIPKTTTKKVTK